MFVVYSQGKLVESFPAEVIDFDASNLPEPALSSLEEAITCHAARCYRASAIMIRRTLEAVCDDRSAQGRDLNARVEALGGAVTLPTELLEGVHDLRLLGNDAAHIEAKVYDEVGCEEVEVAIDVVKLLLLTTYQYVSVVERLQGLKRGS